VSIPFRDGELLDLSSDANPTEAFGWGHEGRSLSLGADATHYCFVLNGRATALVQLADGEPYEVLLHRGMYLASPHPIVLGGGQGIVVSRLGYRGMFMIGGPLEAMGRLRYIDGCTDSLLIPPVVKGAPCLNHLHFPKRISQTRHTHPSIRIGVVTQGGGVCVVPDDSQPSIDVSIPLREGSLFWIPSGGQHSFCTGDEEMDLIAYHPDSDTGPDHDDHPMINRTIVNGVSAARISPIRTAS
jgi:hypothetical protein